MLKRTVIIFSFMICFVQSSLFSQSYYDYELKSITFSGNNFFSESDLKKNIESKESPMWFWVFLNSFTSFGDEPVYFDSSKISIDKLALKEFYRSNGFFTIDVEHSIIPDSSNNTIELHYSITENKYFNYGKFNLFGLNKLSDIEYQKLISESITIDSSKQYSEAEIQSGISLIRIFLANNGYIFGGYDSTIISIDTSSSRTDISIYFSTGDKYSLSETIINKSGKSIQQISNELISEIADLKPGRTYDQSQVDRSELRLLKTELFSSLDITPLIGDTINKTIPVEVNAVISSLNELSPEIKTDNEFNTFNTGLGISYTRKNFLGDARKFSISTSFRLIDILNFNLTNIFKSSENRDSTYQGVIDINLKLEQPFLFGRPILTTTELFLRSQTVTEFIENSYGGAQRFDFEMPAYTYITLLRPFLSFDIAERDFKSKVPGASSELFLSINSFTPGVGIELGSSKTDDIMFPTQGSFFFITPELFHSKTSIYVSEKQVLTGALISDTTITGSTYFYRIQTGISDYRSLGDDRSSVFASKIRIGYAQTFTSSNNVDIGSEQLIPPNKTFYAGGSNSVRGWKSRELVPENEITYAGYTTEDNAFRGGTMWFEGSFEYRKKLMQYFGYALFADYGNTWNGWKEIELKDIAVSLGLGLRVYTPIAPFRLDFGTKFYDPFDQKMIFKKNFWDNFSIHFGIGEAF